MKIARFVRDLYSEIRPTYEALERNVSDRVRSRLSPRWHYEARVKDLESYALKLETGRVADPAHPEDMFGCRIVVENQSRVADAISVITELFTVKERRPRAFDDTWLRPENFGFDDLRLYVADEGGPTLPRRAFHGLVFEVQVQTFLQHAWGIATHDLIYKSGDPHWGRSRVAYQVKAMLENAELSISEVSRLSSSTILGRQDSVVRDTTSAIAELRQRWPTAGALPADVQRLAATLQEAARVLGIEMTELWQIVDAATRDGMGAAQLDVSPYTAILQALVHRRGAGLLKPLARQKKKGKRAFRLFIPPDLVLPAVEGAVEPFLVRVSPPPAAAASALPTPVASGAAGTTDDVGLGGPPPHPCDPPGGPRR